LKAVTERFAKGARIDFAVSASPSVISPFKPALEVDNWVSGLLIATLKEVRVEIGFDGGGVGRRRKERRVDLVGGVGRGRVASVEEGIGLGPAGRFDRDRVTESSQLAECPRVKTLLLVSRFSGGDGENSISTISAVILVVQAWTSVTKDREGCQWFR
jgi:hypothetical protein